LRVRREIESESSVRKAGKHGKDKGENRTKTTPGGRDTSGIAKAKCGVGGRRRENEELKVKTEKFFVRGTSSKEAHSCWD